MTTTPELARYREAIELVEGLHTEHEGRCTHCVEWCECEEYRDCPHGNEPWPCPTMRILANVLTA